jgi:hypothetical protein
MRYVIGLGLVALLASPATFASGAELQPIHVGQPERIEVYPAKFKLDGSREKLQLVVTGYYPDGKKQDLTRAAQFVSSNPAVAALAASVVLPKQDGQAEIRVSVGGKEATAAIDVVNFAKPRPVSFEFDLLAALSKQNCNMGACHGSPSGKGGFRLSLRAFDAAHDKLTLIREDLGRRCNPLAPEDSLLLAKPLMKVPHGGGQKLKKSDPAYVAMRDWIAQGCQPDPDGMARCTKIDVYPPSGQLYQFPAHTQQLSVLATFSDGSVRDVTEMACFSSSDNDIADVTVGGLVIGQRRGEAAIIVRYLEFIESRFCTFVQDIPGFAWNNPPVANYIDEHVYAKLKQLQYLPSGTCSDEEFIRRVYLDVIGLLPTVEETKAFLADSATDKRAKLINALLERPEYARFWALKWGDLLRMTSAQIGGEAVHKYHRWVQRAIAQNMPYDQFCRELLTAQGSTLINPPASFFKTAADTNEAVETTAQVFLGARMQCAKCHNHPFERWTQDNYYGLAAFFNRLQRKKTVRPDELVVFATRAGEVTQPRTGKQMKPWLPLQGDIDPPAEQDRRLAFADWLTKKDNPFLSKVEANRIWSQLVGRGIVEPNDDFRESNPPSNAPLLDALAKDFADHNFDRKHLIRTILNSRTYQADFRPNEFNKEDVKYCSHHQPRLLSAEQMLDAICSMTDLPEQLGPLPPGTKATQIPAPDLVKHDFLKAFGQPERQTVCQCERTSDSNLGMALQFFNGPLIYGKLRSEQNRFRKLLAAGKPHEEIITELYLAGVCRKPSEKELQASLSHLAAKNDPVVALEDICWAILNTNEFLFQH